MKTNRVLLYITLWFLATTVLMGQQISIPRIDQIPNKPSTYKMLDWKRLAKDYDNLVFDVSKTGQYLSLSSINESGINYPDQETVKMYSFVGQNNTTSNHAEAINVISAVVGASLVGVDKTSHLGRNWVVMMKDFFNKKNGQNVYLNGYSSTSGQDWWYDIMPNIYFYQLYNLYPNSDPDFAQQLVTIADIQLDVLSKLGGKLYPWEVPNMNYRAFNLETGQPNSSGLPEPEAAGAIAWVLHQAYLQTGDARYKEGAELALSFLQSWASNPSYELQLPYGIITAARLNAEMGTNYDVNKFLNWAFSSGKGTLRGWGTIIGQWNGYDMSGLIGEANDEGDDYAFVMNGYQHAAALAPVAKYDKRYARAIGKWLLNLASASRYFYPGQLPAENQEPTALQWANQNDINSCIPYEAIKQKWDGKSPYVMGDAFRNNWAKTDLSLYSGSSVGYMASLITPTNVEGILQIDLNKTDFRGEKTYPNYLYYNPNAGQETITLNLPTGNHDLYDAITETVLKSNVSGSVNLTIPTDEVLLLVVYPAGSATTTEGRILKVKGGGIIDYHSGYNYNTSFRVKSFSTSSKQIDVNQQVTFNCLTENSTGAVTYKWYVDNTEVTGETNSSYLWTATKGGIYKVKAVASNNGKEVSSHELETIVIGGDFVIPTITALGLDSEGPFDSGEEIGITATTNAPNAIISWECDGGTLTNTTGLNPKWKLPSAKGYYTVTLTIKNALGEVSSNKRVQVIDANSEEDYVPLVYYSFNGNTKNLARNAFHATSEGATLTSDARENPNSAYRIVGSSQYIYTPNAPELNFIDQMTLSFWIKPEALGTEQFLISHGSWNDRFKVSFTPERKLIMTLNTSGGIIDMADETPLVDGKFYHYVMVYDGTKLCIYRDGVLVNSRTHSGTIGKTSKDLVIGRMFTTELNYAYKGVIDEFRLYDVAVSADYASKLKDEWDIPAAGDVSIKKLIVNGIEWDINKNFVLDCGDNIQKVPVAIEPFDGATLSIEANTFVEIKDKPSLNSLKFTITSMDGTTTKEYNLIVEKRFEYDKLISQKWNNLLTINNNKETNGGFNFVSYKWFKNGEEIGRKQYYSAGKNATDHLDPTANYMAEVITDKGEVLHTCESRPVIKKTASFLVYPNPANAGELITIDTGLTEENIQNGKLFVYSISGVLILQQEVKSPTPTFTLSKSGTYVLKIVANSDLQFSSTIIVK